MREIIRAEEQETDEETRDWKKAIEETKKRNRDLEKQPAAPSPEPAHPGRPTRKF